MPKILFTKFIFSLFTISLVFLVLPKTIYAATCSYKFEPPEPTTKTKLTVTVTPDKSVQLGSYLITRRTKEGNHVAGTELAQFTSYDTPMIVTFDPDESKFGEFVIEVTQNNVSSDAQVCNNSPVFKIVEVPQQSCSFSLPGGLNTTQVLAKDKDLTLKVNNSLAESKAVGVFGGYALYVDGHNNIISYPDNSPGYIKIPFGKFGDDPTSRSHSVILRSRCTSYPGSSCYEALQCEPLTFNVIPTANPICRIAPKNPPSNFNSTDHLVIIGDNLPKANHFYYTNIYKREIDPTGNESANESASLVSQSKDYGYDRTDITGHAAITLPSLDEGDYTVNVVDIPDSGPTKNICTTPSFHVGSYTPPPAGQITCSIPDNLSESDPVKFKAEGVDENASYALLIDGAEDASKIQRLEKPGILNIDLGTFKSDSIHKVDILGSNGEKCATEVSFQTKAALTAPPAKTCKGDLDCTTSAGTSCTTDKNNPGIATAIGCIHTKPEVFVKDLMTFAIGIGGGISFLMMLLGAFQMLTSSGNPDTLKAGQDRLSSAIIGLLFIIFSVLLLQIIGVDILKLPELGK